jgi:formylglycine-generating enzyme required for sulfatase activity
MVAIPAGQVTLSDRRSQRRWPVELRAYLLAAVPVTRAQYASVTGRPSGGGWFDERWSCRASVRRRSHPTYAVDDVGFRIARSPS